eukprot:m51a1_g3684 hypothetical protein (920) ;mRNA; r:324474-327923
MIFHLIAANAEERDKWVVALKSVRCADPLERILSRSSSPCPSPSPVLRRRDRQSFRAGDDEQPDFPLEDLLAEEEARFESDVLWAQGAAGGEFQPAFIAAHSDEIFVFEARVASTPLRRVPLEAVLSVAAAEGSETDVVCALAGGEQIVFRARDAEARGALARGLEEKRRGSVDIVASLGIPQNYDEDAMVAESSGVLDIGDVDRGATHMLIQIVGKRKLRAWVTEVAASRLNPSNAFVLDIGAKQFVWNGSKATRIAKAKAFDLAQRIRVKDRSCRSEVVVIDQGVSDNNAEFWSRLPGDRAQQVQHASAAEQDAADTPMRVYRVCPLGARKRAVAVVCETTDAQLPSKDLLHANMAYVVDAGAELYVWVGKCADADQRKLAMLVAKKLRAQEGRKAWAYVMRVLQGAEPMIMKEKFCGFPGMLPINGMMELTGNVASATPQKSVGELVAAMQAEALHEYEAEEAAPAAAEGEQREQRDAAASASAAAAGRTIEDDGTGTLRVWKIGEYELVEYPQELYGQFWSGESYVMAYTYTRNRDYHIVYFWQGRDSTINEKGTSAFLTAGKAAEIKGGDKVEPLQIRIVQYKETEHFLKVFRGRYVIHAGKLANYSKESSALYDVRGDSLLHCRAVETQNAQRRAHPQAVGSLHSFHSFVAKTAAAVYVWHGRYSNEHERGVAASAARTVAGEALAGAVVEVAEGAESAAFWEALGGVGWYYSPDRAPGDDPRAQRTAHTPRVFACSQGSGAVRIARERQACQDDLGEHGACVVDAWHAVWVWVGPKASGREKRVALEAARAYARAGHWEGAPVLLVQPFHEPAAFRAAFQAWGETRLRLPRGETTEEREGVAVESVIREYNKRGYAYEELLAETLPEGVDPTRLEEYLAEDDFPRAFKTDMASFFRLKKWQQESLKREAGLY